MYNQRKATLKPTTTKWRLLTSAVSTAVALSSPIAAIFLLRGVAASDSAPVTVVAASNVIASPTPSLTSINEALAVTQLTDKLSPQPQPQAHASSASSAFEFEVVGDGYCLDGNDEKYDRVFYALFPNSNLDHCKELCLQCHTNGHNLVGLTYSSVYHSPIVPIPTVKCQCYFEDGDTNNKCEGASIPNFSFTGMGPVSKGDGYVVPPSLGRGEVTCYRAVQLVPSPSEVPSSMPTILPSSLPSASDEPSDAPSASSEPSSIPSSAPSDTPSGLPSSALSGSPSSVPSSSSDQSEPPSSLPSSEPNDAPSVSAEPSSIPSSAPSDSPTGLPSSAPSDSPSSVPSSDPSRSPSRLPSSEPSDAPSVSAEPSSSSILSSAPSDTPSGLPSSASSDSPSSMPSHASSAFQFEKVGSGFCLDGDDRSYDHVLYLTPNLNLGGCEEKCLQCHTNGHKLVGLTYGAVSAYGGMCECHFEDGGTNDKCENGTPLKSIFTNTGTGPVSKGDENEAPNGVVLSCYRAVQLPSDTPSAIPSSKPSASPSKVPSVLPIKYVGNNGRPRQVFPLGRCFGDCDNDKECAGELICHQRGPNEPVPGCSGRESDRSRTDYCILPSDITSSPSVSIIPSQRPSVSTAPSASTSSVPSAQPSTSGAPTAYVMLSIKYVGNNGSPENKYPLGRCFGDCDNDNECDEGLICHQREPNEPVPGCIGGESDRSRTDYCIPKRFKDTSSPSASPSTSTIPTVSLSPSEAKKESMESI